jgi:multidrug efflux pump subunit AcrA (membrane-fusion protein)
MDALKTFRELTVLKLIPILIALAAIVGAALFSIKQQTREEPATPFSEPARSPYKRSVAGGGMVESRDENISIGVPMASIVTEVLVKTGERVTKNQPLIQLDQRELNAQLLTQEAQIKISEARRKNAEANVKTSQAEWNRVTDHYNRWKSVEDPRAISLDDLKTKENDVKVAEANLEAAKVQVESTQADIDASKARVEETRLLLQRLTIRAPRDATVLRVNIRPGEFANVNPKNPVIVLGDIQNLQVRAMIDEHNAPRVKKDRPATAFLKGDTTRPIPLQFVRIEPLVVPKENLTGASLERTDTRVLEVIYNFEPSPSQPVYVGQILDVYIEGDEP